MHAPLWRRWTAARVEADAAATAHRDRWARRVQVQTWTGWGDKGVSLNVSRCFLSCFPHLCVSVSVSVCVCVCVCVCVTDSHPHPPRHRPLHDKRLRVPPPTHTHTWPSMASVSRGGCAL